MLFGSSGSYSFSTHGGSSLGTPGAYRPLSEPVTAPRPAFHPAPSAPPLELGHHNPPPAYDTGSLRLDAPPAYDAHHHGDGLWGR